MNIVQNITSALGATKKADEKEAQARRRDDWFEAGRKSSGGQERRWRRAVERARQNTEDRFYKQQRRAIEARDKDKSVRAVAVLREIERRAGRPAGTLRAQLMAEGALPIYLTTGSKQHGYTAEEILHAFGIDDDAIIDLYEGLVNPDLDEAERYARTGKLDADRFPGLPALSGDDIAEIKAGRTPAKVEQMLADIEAAEAKV